MIQRNEQFAHQTSRPSEDSLDLDKYIDEVLGSMLEEDYAITDDYILDAFTERTVIVTALSTPAQITGEGEGEDGGGGGGGGGLSFRHINWAVVKCTEFILTTSN